MIRSKVTDYAALRSYGRLTQQSKPVCAIVLESIMLNLSVFIAPVAQRWVAILSLFFISVNLLVRKREMEPFVLFGRGDYYEYFSKSFCIRTSGPGEDSF